jgi:hypothetical protein
VLFVFSGFSTTRLVRVFIFLPLAFRTAACQHKTSAFGRRAGVSKAVSSGGLHRTANVIGNLF